MAKDERQINSETELEKEDSDELFKLIEQKAANKQMLKVVDQYIDEATKLLDALRVDRKNLSESIEIGNSYGASLVIQRLPYTISNHSPNLKDLMYPAMKFAISFGLNS